VANKQAKKHLLYQGTVNAIMRKNKAGQSRLGNAKG
jgi:hypothetical protein